MKFQRAVSLTLALGIAALATVAVAAAPAQAKPSASGTNVQVETQVEPLSIQDCKATLEYYQYTVGYLRIAACAYAAIGQPDTARAIATCTSLPHIAVVSRS